MRKILTLLFISLVANSAGASIVPEIEDYYTKKVSDYVQTRFPQRPYTVFVKVDTGDVGNIKRGELADRKAKNLPYLDVVEDNDFWSRTDLPLASFLPYLKTVYVKLEVDANLTPQEFENFKQDLFDHLKLSPAADRIEVTQMHWTPQNEFIPRQYILGFALGVPVVLLLMFFAVTRMGVRSLVKGLAEPLTNISKSTEAFAGQSAVMAKSQWSGVDSSMNNKSFIESSEDREKISELLTKTSAFFTDLDGKTLGFIEKWGARYPASMGAILSEMNAERVKELFRWGVGDWWTQALTQPASWDSWMMQILNEAHHEWRRQELLSVKNVVSADEKILSLSLARLTPREIGIVLKGKNLETVEPVLQLLPQDVMINVCKYMFPGEWGKIIDKKRQVKNGVSELLQKELYKKAIDMKPLRDEKDVTLIYLEADLIKYLNGASTKDEREVYRTLPEGSSIAVKRFPFYKVFEAPLENLKSLAADIALDEWAAALLDCDREETDKVMQLFTDRQKFMLKSAIAEIKNNDLKDERKIQAKRKIAMTLKQQQLVAAAIEDTHHKNEESRAA